MARSDSGNRGGPADRHGPTRGAGAAGPAAGPAQAAAGRPDRSRLSEREAQILGLIARGRSNRQIGELLQLSEGTVKGHVHRILLKLGAADRTQATIAALRKGILTL